MINPYSVEADIYIAMGEPTAAGEALRGETQQALRRQALNALAGVDAVAAAFGWARRLRGRVGK
jgi:hypothetical protein